jgi:hypothetical protein
MNDRRYRSYVYVSQALGSDLFDASEREVLLDAAEGLLLMRAPEPVEIGEFEANINGTLNDLIADGRILAATAAELRGRICECGPEAATPIAS